MAVVGRNMWEECQIYKFLSFYRCAVVAVGVRTKLNLFFFFLTQLNAVLPLSRAVRVAEGIGVCKRLLICSVRKFGKDRAKFRSFSYSQYC